MAGGEGRRLRPITASIPKPLVALGEMSVLELLLHQLRFYGFEEAILCVGHQADLVMAVVGDGRQFGLDVRFHHECEPRGTVGALADVVDWLDDSFLLMNGDLCTDLDYGNLLAYHRTRKSASTVATFRREERLELGVLELDPSESHLVGFHEKPLRHYWVAMGINAFDRNVVDLIPTDDPFGFDHLMGAMLEAERPVGTYHHQGFWLDIGRPDDYERILDQLPALRRNLFPWEQHLPPRGT